MNTNKKPVLVVLAVVVALAVGYYFGNQQQTRTSDPVSYASSTALAQASKPTSAARTKESNATAAPKPASKTLQYVYNKNTHKFHYPSCSSVDDMSERNKVKWYESREALIRKYPSAVPCKRCNP